MVPFERSRWQPYFNSSNGISSKTIYWNEWKLYGGIGAIWIFKFAFYLDIQDGNHSSNLGILQMSSPQEPYVGLNYNLVESP